MATIGQLERFWPDAKFESAAAALPSDVRKAYGLPLIT